MSLKKGNTIRYIGGISFGIGIFVLIIANITGIGTFLYQWGKLDLELGISAWSAFVIWIQMIIAGVVLLIGGRMVMD